MNINDMMPEWLTIMRCVKKYCMSHECNGCIFDEQKICYNLNRAVMDDKIIKNIQDLLGSEKFE